MHRKSVYERVGARVFPPAGGGKESAAAATREGSREDFRARVTLAFDLFRKTC